MKTNQDQIDVLCKTYSVLLSKGYETLEAQDILKTQLDDQFSGLQTFLRQKLSRVCRGSGAVVMRSQVWASIDHRKRPVTVTAISSGNVLIRKGWELSWSYLATESNIIAESEKIKAAIAVLK
jgi:hypothetical protein